MLSEVTSYLISGKRSSRLFAFGWGPVLIRMAHTSRDCKDKMPWITEYNFIRNIQQAYVRTNMILWSTIFSYFVLTIHMGEKFLRDVFPDVSISKSYARITKILQEFMWNHWKPRINIQMWNDPQNSSFQQYNVFNYSKTTEQTDGPADFWVSVTHVLVQNTDFYIFRADIFLAPFTNINKNFLPSAVVWSDFNGPCGSSAMIFAFSFNGNKKWTISSRTTDREGWLFQEKATGKRIKRHLNHATELKRATPVLIKCVCTEAGM